MILYLDTSAYIKLYVEEAESPWLRRKVSQASNCCTQLIAYAEMRAGLARATRMRRLSAEEHAYQLAQFERDWNATRLVQTDLALVRRAGELAEQYSLRGYDSVHLAAAEAIFRTIPQVDFRVAVFDHTLAMSVRALGMTVLDGS